MSVAVSLGLLLAGSVALAGAPVVDDVPPPFAGVWRRPDGGLVRVGRDASSAFLMDFSSRRRWRLEPRSEGLWSLEGSRPAALAQWRAPTLTLSGVAPGALVLEPVPVRTEELTLRAAGDVTLSATLWLPAGDAPRHAVVLLHEAGQGTRESLEPYPAFLVEQGLAVLTFDARGTGRSTGDSQPWVSGVRELAEDGLVAARALRERVAGGGSVGLMGFWPGRVDGGARGGARAGGRGLPGAGVRRGRGGVEAGAAPHAQRRSAPRAHRAGAGGPDGVPRRVL